MTSTDPLDPVTRFLKAQGLEPTVACFGSSDFVIGSRVRLSGFELVYRVEGDQMIVCDFLPGEVEGKRESNGAVMAFVRFVHGLERQVPELESVRGMFLESLSNPALTAERQRLARVLQSQGAVWHEIDGDPWLVYPMSAAKRGVNASAGAMPA
ncbi:secretion protein [Trinickia sp. EG282A]|uniref:secretion protein n=1 Tax=Trinickia sp. EG282A TaxID=3237013 RepID=UPI0034D1782F